MSICVSSSQDGHFRSGNYPELQVCTCRKGNGHKGYRAKNADVTGPKMLGKVGIAEF